MQRLTVAAVTAAALGAVLLTGCADPCASERPYYYNTEDGQYHYDNVGGPLVPDELVQAGCSAEQQGDDVDIDVVAPKPGNNHKPQQPKVQPAKPAPAPARPAPAPKAGK